MINLIVSCFASFILAVMYLKEPGNDYNSAIVNYYGSKLKVFFHIFFYSFIILFACSFINWQFFIVLMIGVFLYLFFLNESLKGKPSQKFQEEAKIQKEKAKEKARIQKEKARIQKEEAEEKARIQKEEADKQQNIKFQMISNLKKTILIFDSNIYMNSIYEDIFHFLRENNFNNLLMFQEQYDEISNLQIYESRVAKREIDLLSKSDVLTIYKIDIQSRKGAYADPVLINNIRNFCSTKKVNIVFVTDDKDLSIRTVQLVKADGYRNLLDVYSGSEFQSIISSNPNI
jgi:ABC-type multidrug transport system fused ATPase/permease subunit